MFTTEMTKRKVLNKAKELCESKNEQNKKVFIKLDLTPTQQEKEQVLLKELRKKTWSHRKTHHG